MPNIVVKIDQFSSFTDNRPPGMVPMKALYLAKDLSRLSKYYDIPLQQPAVRPSASRQYDIPLQ